jgi:type I restriction enzyme R subunit
LRKIADKLFSFDTDNLENFQRQISTIENKGEVLDLRQTLALYKELYNLAQLFGYEELTASLDRDKIRTLYQLTEQRLQLLREKEALQNPEDMDSLIELAAHDIQFTFHKVSEGELSLADAFASKRRQTIGEFGRNQDKKDPEFLQLWEELRRILEGHDIQEMTVADMQEQDKKLEILRQKMHDLNAANARLTERYGGDIRYMRLHKNLTREGLITSPSLTFEFLQDMKAYMDDSLLHKETILTNEKFFLQTLWKEIKQDLGGKQPLTVDIVKAIGNEIKNEYI